MHKIISILSFVVFLILSGTELFAVNSQDMQLGGRMPDSAINGAQTTVLIQPAFSLNIARMAVLIMDYENDIVNMLPENVQTPLLEKASTILRASREAHVPVVYIVVRFRDGYPEINLQNKLFSSLKESGRLREGTLGAEIHAKVAPQPGDIIVTKRREGLSQPQTLKRSSGPRT